MMNMTIQLSEEPYQLPHRAERLQVPLLMFHGLKDWALLPGALTIRGIWVDKINARDHPRRDAFCKQDARSVTRTMVWVVAR